jgi:hypothetical protein
MCEQDARLQSPTSAMVLARECETRAKYATAPSGFCIEFMEAQAAERRESAPCATTVQESGEGQMRRSGQK